MIAVGLDQIAHALDRVGLEAIRLVTPGKSRRRHALAASRLDIGTIKPLHRIRRIRAEID